MTANFAYVINNISKSSNENNELIISQESIEEISSNKIEDFKIPKTASAIILFKNKIECRDNYGQPILSDFAPTDIKQYIITTEEFLSIPILYSRFIVAKDLLEGYVGAYILRDGTLFVLTEKMKKNFIPLLDSQINENGYYNNNLISSKLNK